jgi:hypothetical protein
MIRTVEWNPDSLPVGSVWIARDPETDRIREVQIIQYSPTGLYIQLLYANAQQAVWLETALAPRTVQFLDRLPTHEYVASSLADRIFKVLQIVFWVILIAGGVIGLWAFLYRMFPGLAERFGV